MMYPTIIKLLGITLVLLHAGYQVQATKGDQSGCWTPWFDRDNPSGTGDYEALSDLHKEHPGKICQSPIKMEVQTTSGASVASTGNVIDVFHAHKGFICRNRNQPYNGNCADYKVRFLCPLEFCKPQAQGCWTQWFNRDDPSGTGDYETLGDLLKENPRKLCRHPLKIEIQTTSGESADSTGNVFDVADEQMGCICRNRNQPRNTKCADYEVRFFCPPDFCKSNECWTPWFNRDNPSGAGDHETLSDLHNENPGKICQQPLNMEVQTTSGASVASTGNWIYIANAQQGFVCLNAHQQNSVCADYKVRFLCQLEFCQPQGDQGCWTPWYDRDNPSGTGDYETLSDLHKENPGKICQYPLQMEVQTTSGASVASTGNVIDVSDVQRGFICKNQNQPYNRQCADYKVRFFCPLDFCQPKDDQGCWTPWYDRDNPSGTGDYETLSDLHKENPGKICQYPLQMEVQTTSGASVASTGNVIDVSDVQRGFICKNQNQPFNRQCADYKVRFFCPLDFCQLKGDQGCWTPWYDRDNPSGAGDYETLSDLNKENPGKICQYPLQMEVQTTSGASVASTGNVIDVSDVQRGFICKNQNQPQNRQCADYKVRFFCPLDFCQAQPNEPECWTPWYDRDNPSGTGDFETLSDLHKENPGKICQYPSKMEAITTSGASVSSTGNVIDVADPHRGLICRNRDQPYNRQCADYKVRFSCPLEFCKPEECWTTWFNWDNPSGMGDYELLFYLRKYYPWKICNNPLKMEVQTTSGASVASTGNVIYASDTRTGFICRNSDQPYKRNCANYKVRFQCPTDFCKPQGCKTQWYNRDDPGGTGDYEVLESLRIENPNQICPAPLDIEVQTVDGNPLESTGEVIATMDKTTGFICKNADQKNGLCSNYKVRFTCPIEFCMTRG